MHNKGVLDTYFSSVYIPRIEKLIKKVIPNIKKIYCMFAFKDILTSKGVVISKLPVELLHMILNSVYNSLSALRVFDKSLVLNESIESKIIIKADVATMVFKPEAEYNSQFELDHA